MLLKNLDLMVKTVFCARITGYAKIFALQQYASGFSGDFVPDNQIEETESHSMSMSVIHIYIGDNQ